MSFRHLKRLQRDLDRLPKYLRAHELKLRNRAAFPGLEEKYYVPVAERRNKEEEVGLAVGDLVYIKQGPGKGRVTYMSRYVPREDVVFCMDVHTEQALPKKFLPSEQPSQVVEIPVKIPREHVRLAAKDKDEKGNITYVVAEEVAYAEKYYDSRYKRWLPRRVVKHHEELEIPWPNPDTEPREDALLTPPEVALEKTWEMQTIGKSPLPHGVLAELRNPYSRHRKFVLSEEQARRLNAPEMPLSEAQKRYLAKKAQQPAKPLQPLLEEVQTFIGEKMALHLAQVQSPHLMAHLEDLSRARVPDFAKTMAKLNS